jgi:hypothetical protein
MTESITELRVTLAGDGFYPQMFRWADRDVRVLFVEGMRTCGLERRFRVRTVEGTYELSQHTRCGVWQMRRSPSWVGRTLAHISHAPRYSLPMNQRRVGRAQIAPRGSGQTLPSQGGQHANGAALV